MQRINVIDCGGRGGIHRSWQGVPFSIAYFSFEPDQKESNSLTIKKAEQDKEHPHIEFYLSNSALDRIKQKRTLNLYSQRDLSSFYQFNAKACYRYTQDNVKLEKQEQVNCITADMLRAEFGHPFHFISIDAQGATLDVLSGAEKILSEEMIGVRCEGEFVDLYQQATSTGEILSFMKSRGYILTRIESCGPGKYGISSDMNNFSVNSADALPVWCDLIFINNNKIELALECDSDQSAFEIVVNTVFSLHNGCGYWGLEKLAQYLNRHGSKSILNIFSATEKAIFYQHLEVYLSLSRDNPRYNQEQANSILTAFNIESDSAYDQKLTHKIHNLYSIALAR